jgi:drug/metabolite transporter (DMT)-like permease
VRLVSLALALLSSLLWGTADFLGGTLTRRRAALVVVGVSQAVGLLTVVVVAVASGALGDARGYLPYALAAGVAGVVGLVAFYAALATGTMGVVSPIAATGVVVPVLVGLARGESPSRVVLAGIALAVLGVVLASGPELAGAAGARPLLLAAVAATGFGLALLFIADGSRTSPLMTMVAMRAASVSLLVVAGVAVALRGRADGRAIPGPARRWTLVEAGLLVLIGIADVMANLTFGLASRGAYVSVVAVLGSLYPIATVLLAMGVHGERLARIQALGVTAALGGVVLIAGG